MAHYTGPKNRLSRREGVDLFGRGLKLRRATVPPGQHGPKSSRRRTSDFGVQLREKQKTKRIYGIMERQFRTYFERARRVKGTTGEVLLRMLETRLDNVVYRLGFTPTRAMARQLVSHGHVQVNGHRVNIPSYQAKVGDKVGLDKIATAIPTVAARLEPGEYLLPAWLKRHASEGEVARQPERGDVEGLITEQLIVEFYSR